MRASRVILLVLTVGLWLSAATVTAPIFGDHAVLQRNQPIVVWGWDAAGTKVSATLNGKSASAVADGEGRFQITLPAMPAGGPYELKVAGTSEQKFQDIFVGEVWIGSGQSNMKMGLRDCTGGRELAQKSEPRIRVFTVPLAANDKPLKLEGGNWQPLTDAKKAEAMSGLGVFFAHELLKTHDMAIGFVDCSYGGTLGEAWTDPERLKHPELQPILARYKKYMDDFPENNRIYEEHQSHFQRLSAALYNPPKPFADTKSVNDQNGWSKPEFDDSQWKSFLRNTDLQVFWDGLSVVWFRIRGRFPDEWRGKMKRLSGFYTLGRADFFFNGVPMGSYPKTGMNQIALDIPESCVNDRDFVLTMRVYTQRLAAGFRGLAMFTATGASGAVQLKSHYRYCVEASDNGTDFDVWPRIMAPMGPTNKNFIGGLYFGMMHKIAPFAAAGVLWYQGEANNDRGIQYRILLPEILKSWRGLWGRELPFVIIQLPNYGIPPRGPTSQSYWAELREAQAITAANDDAAIIVPTIDVGQADNIHPANKAEVARRAALAAATLLEKKPGGESLAYAGMETKGREIRIRFTPNLQLHVKNGPEIKRLVIAGADKVFHEAVGRIEGNTLVVSSDAVAAPVMVRYAWAENPEGCNLYGPNDIPVIPFRTDNEPGISQKRK